MPVSDTNPFFQEFEATFESHSVGMRIRKTHDVPVVHELVKTPNGEESPAALAGVPPTAVLVGVAGERTLRLGYEEAIGRISGRGRPITLAFRQLHAAIDGGEARRYWQGYLRLKTGGSVWTGSFYVLREDGSLSSFPSKDIQGQTPVKVMRVGSDCALIHGETLKQFLGGDAAVSGSSSVLGGGGSGWGEGHDGAGGGGGGVAGSGVGVGAGANGHAWWLECFAVLAPDGLQLFRASTPAGRLDWVAALAIVSTSHDLGVWKPPQPSAAAAISSAAANGEDCSSVSGSKNNDLNPPRRRWSLSYRRRCDSDVRGQSQDEQEEEEDNEGVSGETEAVGERISANGGGENGVTAAGRGAVAAAPRMVMQGFLRKRIAGRMWGASEEWEYRWIVLRDDGRLLWYLSVPADPGEVPNGHIRLRGAKISVSEGALLRNNLREDEVRRADLCPFMVDADARPKGEREGSRGKVPDEMRPAHGRPAKGNQREAHQQQQQQQQHKHPTFSALQQQEFEDQGHGERRVIFFSAWGADERVEWADALSRYAQGGEAGLDLRRELRKTAKDSRIRRLHRFQDEPEEVLAHPHEAFALLLGGRRGGSGGGGVTRAEFCDSAAQHLLPMCDIYTAGIVFDALCPKRMDVPDNAGASSTEGFEELLGLVGEGTEAGGADGVRTGRVPAEALAGVDIGERLTFDVFRRYAEALSSAFRPTDAHPSWEDVRLRLGLHPMEALLLGEEFVAEIPKSSSQLDLMALTGWSGTLFLTDRHLLLHFPKKQEVRVVPVGSIKGIIPSSSRAGPFTVDDAIELIGCEVHTVPLGLKRDETPGKEAAAAAAAAAAEAAAQAVTVTATAAEGTSVTSAATAVRVKGKRQAASAKQTVTTVGVAVNTNAAPISTMPPRRGRIDADREHLRGGKNGGDVDGSGTDRGGYERRNGKRGHHRGGSSGGGGGGSSSSGSSSIGVGERQEHSVEEAARRAAEMRETGRKPYRLVFTKVKMQRLVSGPEGGGKTREEWLDYLREIVEAHHLSRPSPTRPASTSKPKYRTPSASIGVQQRDSVDVSQRLHDQTLPLIAGMDEQDQSVTVENHERIDLGAASAASVSEGATVSTLRRRRGGSATAVGEGVSVEAPSTVIGNARGGAGVRRGVTAADGSTKPSLRDGGGDVAIAAPDSWRKGGAIAMGELGRLARKVGALIRDPSPSSSLEAFHIEEARLRLWVGANIMRSRALSKTTGSSARPLLLLTSKNNSSSNRDVLRAFCGSFSGTTVGGVARDTVNVKGRGGGDKVEADRRRSTVRGSSTESGVQHGARHNGTGRVGGGKRRRWLLTLARFMARPREFERRRAAAVRAFTPQKFRQEWELFWELLDPMFDAFDTTTADLLGWKRPFLSFSVMSALLLVAYNDLVRYALPLALLSNVAYLLAPATARKAAEYASAVDGTVAPPPRRGTQRGREKSGEDHQHTRRLSGNTPASYPGHRSRSVSPPSRGYRADPAAHATGANGTGRAGGRVSKLSPASSISASEKMGDQGAGVGAVVASSHAGGSSSRGERPGGKLATGEVKARSSSTSLPDDDRERLHDVNQGATVSGRTSKDTHGNEHVDEHGGSGAGSGSQRRNQHQHQHQQQQQQQQEGIFSRVKNMQNRAGKTQAKLHSYNAVLLKIKSLHSWSDPGRTKAWVVAVSLLAAILTLVPSRYTFSAVVLFLFTEPIRPKGKTIPEVLFEDFWDGLPVESGTHTNVRMAAIYSQHNVRNLG